MNNKVQRVDKIFKRIPELDSEIRKIIHPFKEQEEWIVEVGIYESIGEQGMIHTMFFDSMPIEEAIIEELKAELIEARDNFKDAFVLSATEEHYLEILNRLNL